MLDIILISLGLILLIVGLVGCILPVLPGPPISFAGIMLLHFTSAYSFSKEFLVLWGVIAIGVTVLDNVIPVWGAKKFGGSKKAVWGSVVGLVLGLIFFPPFGIIIGPFLGAVLGELADGKHSKDALRAGFGAFAGFIGGIVMKLIVSGCLIYFFFKTLLF